ncbi:MAG: hypothetical protein ACRDTZ_22400 [Pseudonocardiaceae bacterium]
MSDPLSSAVLSLFHVRARTTAQCDSSNTSTNMMQFCTVGNLLSRNRRNRNIGGTQTNTAGVGTDG